MFAAHKHLTNSPDSRLKGVYCFGGDSIGNYSLHCNLQKIIAPSVSFDGCSDTRKYTFSKRTTKNLQLNELRV